MEKIILCIVSIGLLITMNGCFSKKEKIRDSEVLIEKKVVETVVVTADKTEIAADGKETIILEAIVKDNKNSTMSGITIDYYIGETKLKSNKFSTTMAGIYQITAKVGTVVSNAVVIAALKILENSDLELKDIGSTYEITKYVGVNKQLIIPEMINGKMITSIGNGAFQNLQLTNVYLPNSITSIGAFAFYSNRLTSIIIPDSVKSIGEGAFHLNLIEKLVISNNITKIEYATFAWNKLKSVSIPKNVITIGKWAFYNNQLINIELHDNITLIENFSFANNKLTSVTIPKISKVDLIAFDGNDLTSIHGWEGSSAEIYANYWGISFIANLE